MDFNATEDLELFLSIIKQLDADCAANNAAGNRADALYAEIGHPDVVREVAIDRAKAAVLSDPIANVLFQMGVPEMLEEVARVASIWMTGLMAGFRFAQATEERWNQ